jgi:hypothetical protein
MHNVPNSPSANMIYPGKRIYGVTIGIAIMDRKFPRPVGDLGNALSFPYPVIYETVMGVNNMPARSIAETHEFFQPLYESCMRLVDKGATAITTTCGYAALLQSRLSAALPVVFAASALVLIPSVLATLGGNRKIAVLAARGKSLTAEHLRNTGVAEQHLSRIEIIDLQEAPSFRAAVLDAPGELPLDLAAASEEIAGLCKSAAERDPLISGFVGECSNMGTYSSAIQAATALPVWDGVGLVHWLYQSCQHLQRPSFAHQNLSDTGFSGSVEVAA